MSDIKCINLTVIAPKEKVEEVEKNADVLDVDEDVNLPPPFSSCAYISR